MTCFLFAIALGLGPKTVHMVVSADGKSIGTAKFTQQLLPDGGKQVQVNLDLSKVTGKGVRVRQESVYSPKGEPIRKIQEVTTVDGKRVQLALATFDVSGAKLTLDEGGKQTIKLFPLTKGAPRADASEFWLIRDRPKPGSKTTHYRFDISQAKWTLAESIYVGKTTVNVAGKTVEAHLIRSTDGVAYSDDEGTPMLIQTGNVRMERSR